MEAARPSFTVVIGLLLLPLVLITANTLVSTLATTGAVDEEAGWVSALLLIGQTPIALLITVLVAIAVLGTRGRSMADVEKLLNDSLGPICAIILITGAGGMFGGVLELSGIGESLAASLDALGLPLIIAAFVIATGLRVAQGSATVAPDHRRWAHRACCRRDPRPEPGRACCPGHRDRRRSHGALARVSGDGP